MRCCSSSTWLECYCDTVKVAAAGLEAEPTVTTTDCTPNGAFGGTVKLTCSVPTDQLGMPKY